MRLALYYSVNFHIRRFALGITGGVAKTSTVKIDLSGTKDYKMREITKFRGQEGSILTRFFEADCNQEKLEYTSASAVDEVFGDVFIIRIPVLIPAADCSYWGL